LGAAKPFGGDGEEGIVPFRAEAAGERSGEETVEVDIFTFTAKESVAAYFAMLDVESDEVSVSGLDDGEKVTGNRFQGRNVGRQRRDTG
jgi:hypothetical protein